MVRIRSVEMPEADLPEGDGSGPTGPTTRGFRVPWWLVVVVILVVWALASQVMTLRNRTNELTAQVAALESRITSPLPVVPTTAPALDIPPADSEAARRAVNEAVRVVFAAAPTLEQRLPFVAGPPDLAPVYAPLLAALSRGPCAAAVPVLTDVRFTSDDRAMAKFRAEGTTVAAARDFLFEADLVRGTERWQVTAESVGRVAELAAAYC